MSEPFRIGQLAERCGVSRDTIRFYERAGLLPKPRRTESRHRVYDQAAAEQIRFIRQAQDLGLTLEDIRRLIEALESRSVAAGLRATEILRSRLETIEQRIAVFEMHRDRLKQAIGRIGERPDIHFVESSIDENRSLQEA